ncbi:MAG TPA: hypothetical protein PKK15_05645 [Kouleothrix sp.]|nr:hypothetical protein [Kouleothrix sp.]
MIDYVAYLFDPFGRYRTTISQFIDADGAALDYTVSCVPGAVGECVLTPPLGTDPSLFVQDGRIAIGRSINGRAPVIDMQAIFLIKEIEDSATSTIVRAAHTNCLLHTRTINYPADSAYVQRAAAPADDQIKALARENLGSLINTGLRYGVETQADLSAYLQIAPDLAQGASVPVADIAQRTLGEVIRDLCAQSATAGTYLTAMVEAITPALLELRTYAGQRGLDRRAGVAVRPIVLSEATGTVENVKVIRSWREAATFVIAGGAGESSDRLIATAFDAVRAAASPFGRVERFVESSDTDTPAVLQGVADAALRQARETRVLTADLRETDGATRGLHYDLGDVLTVEHARTQQQFDARLDVVRVSVGGGQQRSQAALRSL